MRKVLLLGGAGGLGIAYLRHRRYGGVEAVAYNKAGCDVRDRFAVMEAFDRIRPDFVINCAGISDFGHTTAEVLGTNLLGAINVGDAGAAFGTPTLLIGSTAGMEYPALHPTYGASKAGVIAWVASAGKRGVQTYCLSPNRMDTPMRERDWPGEDVATRLIPGLHVVPVIEAIIDGHYPPGANVVVRKVGTSGRVDVFQAPTVEMQGML